VPGVSQLELSASFVRRAFRTGRNCQHAGCDLAGDARSRARASGPRTRYRAALLTTDRRLCAGDVLWTDVSITYGGYCSDFGRTWLVGAETLSASTGSVRAVARHPGRRARRHPAGADIWRPRPSGDRGQRRNQTMAATLLPGSRHRYLPGRNTLDRNRSGEEFDDNFVFPVGMAWCWSRWSGDGTRRLPQRGDRDHHRTDTVPSRLPYAPYGY